ncbi:hypothetical protein HDU89_003627 [Geranomyces variabilis]|nr:hypothetical protein HDU89_003627 [Geranomyces variabilis]
MAAHPVLPTLIVLAVILGLLPASAWGVARYARHRLRVLMKPSFPVSNTPMLKEGEKKQSGVLYVHVPDLRPWGHPNASPFSLKLETWLRMAGIPYVVIRGFNLRAAPKGKIPYIEIDDVVMGDSELIIQFLQKRFPEHRLPADAALTTEQRGASLAFTRMVSEHTVACMGYSRNVENVQQTFRAYVGLKPTDPLPLALRFIARMVRRGTGKKLMLQGLGKHTRDEIYEIGARDLKAVADFLGDKLFMMGDEPTTVDASVFAVLAEILWIPVEFPMKAYAYAELPVLDAYLHRMRKAVWGSTLEPWYVGGEKAERMYARLGQAEK